MKSSNLFNNLYQPEEKKRNIDGYVMLEDEKVVSYINDEVRILDEGLSPFYILRTNNVKGWVCSRSIDTHRTNSRLLRKAIRLSSREEYDIAMSTYCATITDRYWFKPLNSTLVYNDVKFTSDKLSSIALDGTFTEVGKLDYQSPEFTNTGSFEKCWRLINGEWILIKKATPLEKFSELFVSRLGESLKLNMASYFLDDSREDVILSEDFTSNGMFIFEHMESLIGDNEDYIENINLIESINPNILKCSNSSLVMEYLDILFMDTICMNVDRHTQNYGFLRDMTTGRIVSMAPNFDNNLSLVSRGVDIKRPKMLLDFFIEALEYCQWYTFPKLEEDLISEIIIECNNECGTDIPLDYLLDFIMGNYNYIIGACENTFRFS